jgi:uncharacterized membrane protein YkvA (DUF1232 family)
MILSILIGVGSALLAACLALTVVLVTARPKGLSARAATAIVANVVRLLRGLYRDSDVPRSVRVRVWIAIAYNIQPFNLIPDFVPVIGFADNIVVTAWALRSAVRKAGPDALARHWPGTADQLALLVRVARLENPPGDSWTRPDPGQPATASVGPGLSGCGVQGGRLSASRVRGIRTRQATPASAPTGR